EGAPVLALVAGPVVARADRLPPVRVLAVPRDGVGEPVAEAPPRRPPERAHLLGREGVAAVVPRAIRHVLDQVRVAARELDDALHDLEVRALVGAARVVNVT